METWISRIKDIRIISQNPTFVDVRTDAEEKARQLLNCKCGHFTEDDFNRFLDLVNTEITPRKTESNDLRPYVVRTRFRPAFTGKNRKLMIENLDECNSWIATLWLSSADSLNILDQFWKEGRVKGAGISLPTLIMYLKDPESYNVWTPFLTKGLGILIGKKLHMAKNSINYLCFNDGVNKALRQPFKLRPQEIDYILFRIGVNVK